MGTIGHICSLVFDLRVHPREVQVKSELVGQGPTEASTGFCSYPARTIRSKDVPSEAIGGRASCCSSHRTR